MAALHAAFACLGVVYKYCNQHPAHPAVIMKKHMTSHGDIVVNRLILQLSFHGQG